MNWTKFSEAQPARKGFYWIAIHTAEGKWDIYPEYQMRIGSDGDAHGNQASYRNCDGYWYGPLELPFRLPALVLAA